MSDASELGKIEADAYRSRFDDGLLDLYIGIALLWIGASWMWFEETAAILAVFPALVVTPFVTWRKRFIEERTGYVRFSEPRRRRERRSLVSILVIGEVVLIVGIVAGIVFGQGGNVRDALDWLGPGIIAFIIAIMVGMVAVASTLPRLFAYATLLVVGAVAAASFETSPGTPLLIVGGVVTVWGAVLTTRFVRAHPRVEIT